MKTKGKVLVISAAFAVMTGGSVFAKSMSYKPQYPGQYAKNGRHFEHQAPGKPDFSRTDEFKGKPMNGKPDFGKNKATPARFNTIDDKLIIGKIKALDEASSKITVTLPDGKDTVIYVSSFSHVFKSGKENQKLWDIEKDSEVMISIYKTDSKVPVAAMIVVKN